VTDRRTCEGTTKAGRRCRSFVAGGGYCFPHDPANAERMQAARMAGASKGGKLRAIQGRRSRLSTPAELMAFTARMIHDAVEGKLPPDHARAVFYGLNLQRALVEGAEVEKRIAAIEERLESVKPRDGRGRWA
jgi:hypothetical protein